MSSNSARTIPCHYMKDVIATRADHAGEVKEALDGLFDQGSQDEPPDDDALDGPPNQSSKNEPPDEDSENDPLDVGQLKVLMRGGVDDDVLEDDVLEQMLSLVAVFRTRGRDPHQLATELRQHPRLREEGVEVSPIHALGTLNHLAYMTGTDPEETDVTTPPEIAASSPGRIVAVVDTGVTESLPPWLESGLDFDRADIETLGGRLSASHGTFVAGLIRRIAPEHTISIARASRVSIKSLDPELEDGHEEADDPSTELHVLGAMIRLVNRLLGKTDSCDVAALNLALGGVCEEHDPAFTSLSAALDFWRNAFPRVPIFAAGGNNSDPRPVFPGAFEYVRAVAAAEEEGKLVVWDRNSEPAQENHVTARPWITDVAPGSELVGPSGRTESDWKWVKWSGSSFATAVATGCYASRRPNEALGGLVWWPDRKTTASDIPGLVL